MSAPAPIYTSANCRAAYQLNWVLSIFWREKAASDGWLDQLKDATAADGVRILQHRFEQPCVSQFLVSTEPLVAPSALVRCVKGRLQYLVRHERPKAFRRNFGLRSVGSATREAVERYVESQLGRHRMAAARVQDRLERFQIRRDEVDLAKPRQTAHALYWYNLHVVFIRDGRYMEVREQELARAREVILKASEKHGYLLSRAGIVPDHIHLTLGCTPGDAPCDVALRYMNNLAYACGMKPVFEFGFYVGTFGEYDLGVTW